MTNEFCSPFWVFSEAEDCSEVWHGVKTEWALPREGLGVGMLPWRWSAATCPGVGRWGPRGLAPSQTGSSAGLAGLLWTALSSEEQPVLTPVAGLPGEKPESPGPTGPG